MKQQLQDLDSLLQYLPSSTSCRGISDLNFVLSKYTKILDFVSCCSENYRRATSLYYSGLNYIKDNIDISVYAEPGKEKNSAFESARDKLKKDIEALSMLVKPQEELVSIAV